MGDESHSQESADEEPRDPSLEDVARLCHELNSRGAKYVLVGGFAIILHGYPRYTKDVDFLVETTLENEALVLEAVATLPEHAARQVQPGQIAEHVVVRIGDEILVDLMRSGCGITYADAISDADKKEIHGELVPCASIQTMWRMKQTLRANDAQDRLFLAKLAEDKGLLLDPPPSPPPSEVPLWVEKFTGWLRRVFRRRS